MNKQQQNHHLIADSSLSHGKISVEARELIALLNLSSWCLVMVERLFLAVPRGCLLFVIVVFPDHTHLLFLTSFDQLIIDNVTYSSDEYTR